VDNLNSIELGKLKGNESLLFFIINLLFHNFLIYLFSQEKVEIIELLMMEKRYMCKCFRITVLPNKKFL
jgi:hypothetical protein